MKFLYIIIIINIFLISLVTAQHPDTLWSKKYFEGKYLSGNSSYECADSSLIVTGRYFSDPPEKMFIYKIDSSGNLLWKNYYGGNRTTEGIKIIETNTNSYLCIGDLPYENNSDIWVLNVDVNGDSLWSLQLGTNLVENAKDIIACQDSNYLILGSSRTTPFDTSFIYLSKINLNGELLWEKTISDSFPIEPSAFCNANDGNILIASYRIVDKSYDYYKIFLTMIDSNGNVVWQKDFGAENSRISPEDVIQTNDGGFALVGSEVIYRPESGSFPGNIFFLKTDAFGNVEWSKSYGEDINAYGKTVIENQSGYTLHGIVSEFQSDNQDLWIMRLQPEGDIVWSDRFGDESIEHINSMIRLSDKSLFLTGYKHDLEMDISNLYLIKFEPERMVAGFQSTLKRNLIPAEVQFIDSSAIKSNMPIENYLWDFENDGIIDSHEQNPKQIYFNADTFSVKLIVSNGVLADTLIKENYVKTAVDSFPYIFNIEDIPDDQGGWVKIQFTRSLYDTDSLSLLRTTTSGELYSVEIEDGTGWTTATTTTAYGKSTYSVLVHTTKDSTSESDGKTYFRIIAGMNEGNFVSAIDTAYSVDNLKPSTPRGLETLVDEMKVKLHWQSNLEDDFKYYSVYRGKDAANFEKIAMLIDTVFIDTNVLIGNKYYYTITSTDNSGNESDFSDAALVIVTNLDEIKLIPEKYYLMQNYPNPFNPITTIEYGLKNPGLVRITIYNILGNFVSDIKNGYQKAGRYKLEWNGRNQEGQQVGSGIYYYQICTENFQQAKKMILIK